MQNQENSDIFAPDGLETIFEGKVIKEFDNTGQINNVRIIGYRLEYTPNSKIMTHFRTGADSFGIYKAAVFYNGIRRKATKNKSNFFPKHWTRAQVVRAISDAYANRKIVDVVQNKLSGVTSDGLKIIMWTDDAGKIIGVIPMGDCLEMNRNTRTQPRKSICKICGQAKIKICQSHHHLPLENSIFRIIQKRFVRYWGKCRSFAKAIMNK